MSQMAQAIGFNIILAKLPVLYSLTQKGLSIPSKGFVTLTAMAPIFPNRLLRRIQRPSRYSIRSELGI